ncbi:MAG TPA: hypothetical protein VGJ21_21145 [Terracidiphilus sp.]|jgi:hypothetical protein
MGFLLHHPSVVFLIAVPFLVAFWMLPLWFICKKAGFSPWLTLLNCIPFGNAVLLYLLAFADWKRHPMFQVEPVPPALNGEHAARPHIVARRVQP